MVQAAAAVLLSLPFCLGCPAAGCLITYHGLIQSIVKPWGQRENFSPAGNLSIIYFWGGLVAVSRESHASYLPFE
jgi:hypothetical protein